VGLKDLDGFASDNVLVDAVEVLLEVYLMACLKEAMGEGIGGM
jgi:hypothetical protein